MRAYVCSSATLFLAMHMFNRGRGYYGSICFCQYHTSNPVGLTDTISVTQVHTTAPSTNQPTRGTGISQKMIIQSVHSDPSKNDHQVYSTHSVVSLVSLLKLAGAPSKSFWVKSLHAMGVVDFACIASAPGYCGEKVYLLSVLCFLMLYTSEKDGHKRL